MRTIGEKVNHRWSRDFSVARVSLVPVGKTFGRRELLHILIYFKEGILPRPFTNPPTGIDAPDTVQERSTCFSMETGYLPVTFCGKISSGADPVAFVRACVERSSEFRMRSCLRGWLVRIVFQRKKSIPIPRYLSPSITLVFGYLFRVLRGILI